MLPKTQVVMVRRAIERNYTGICSVFQYQKIFASDKTSGFEEVEVATGVRCKLSMESVTQAGSADNVATISQSVKLFVAPDVYILPGSKIEVKQNGVTTVYKSSGHPSLFATHQEIALELFKGWA